MKSGKYAVIACLLAVGLVMLGGCGKSEPAGHDDHAGHDHGDEGHDHGAVVSEQVDAVVTAAEQTVCPIMGGPIDKAVFIEYEGQKVYFCCPGCEDKFKADPAKYMTKLPQFQK